MTIVLAGLFIDQKYVIVWTLAVCVVQVSQMEYMNWNWNQYAAWCIVYLTAGWLVTLFAKHLESQFEANRVAENASEARSLRSARGLRGIFTTLWRRALPES